MTVIEDQARLLFLSALERGPEQWPAFLDEACGGDTEVRARVEDLLRAHQALGSIHAGRGGGPAVTVDLAPAEQPGTVIGPYKLLEEIGEGGFGVVFLAEQTQPVRRKVALKVLKPGMDTRQVVARFETERQALALMDHPHIAKVFDGGATASGHPYFVMELVKGVPITDFCAQHRLTPRQRLELFVSVCRAVQHAHQKGIIHRDLKPSNVLVSRHDTTPVVKVIDFGLAKALGQELTDKTLFTDFAQMVGTPLYMSPEQAGRSDLDVDTRSDIYSLGVLLYELLTGSTPFGKERFKNAGYDEIRRIIREEEPARPSTRLRTLRQDAATVSASWGSDPRALSRLLRGELDWIIIKALEKDRNRRYETANGFALDVQRYLDDEPVLACPPSAGYRFRKFARRNRRSLVIASVLGVALLFAVGSLGWVVRDREAGRVRTAGEVNQLLQRAESLSADNRLPEAVAEVEKARGVLQAGRGDEDLRRRVRQWLSDLDTAARLEELRLESYDEEDRDRSYADFARVFREYGLDVEALPVEEATARVAASRIKRDLVSALGNWAWRLQHDRRPQDPSHWQRLLAIARTADPDPWRLRYLAAGDAKDLQALREIADGADISRLRTRTLAGLGNALRMAGDVEAAIAFLRRVQQQHPGDFSVSSSLAYCLSELKPPPLDEVIAFRRTALAVRPQSAWAHLVLGLALQKKDRLDEAMVEFREAVRLRPKYADAHTNLGIALQTQKKFDNAIACYRTAIELDPKSATARNNLGNILRDRGELDEAVACHKVAIEIDPQFAGAHTSLGSTLRAQGKLDDAIAAHREAIRLKPELQSAHCNLGNALSDKGRLDESIAAYREAVRLEPQDARAQLALGLPLRDKGMHREAEAAIDASIAAAREAVRLHPNDASAHYDLGMGLHAKGLHDNAIVELREAIRLWPGYPNAHYHLGRSLRLKGRVDEAIAAYREAIHLKPSHREAHAGLAIALREKGLVDEAIAGFRELIRLKPDDYQAFNDLGAALEKKNKLDEAIAAYREGIRLKPDEPTLQRNLGLALGHKGLLDEAIVQHREAIRLRPNFPEAHNALGWTLGKKGLRQEAIAAYREAIRLKPDYFDAHTNLAAELFAEQSWEEGFAVYRKAIEMNPKHGNSHCWMAVLLATCPDPKFRDPRLAVEHARKAVELRPQDSLPLQALGWAHYRAGAWRESIEALEKSCKLQAGGKGCGGQWIVLSLAHWKLSNEKELPEKERARHNEEAHRWFERAAKDIDSWKFVGDDVTRAIRAFRVEAAEVMGMKVKPK
jgi:tetratricopeptide (TPR) repeat protein/serine/threonine protein kinase